MKLMKLKSLLWSLFLAALLVSLPYLCSEAQAQRGGGGSRGGGGGGYHGGGGGGYSGGSFRGGGGYATGPRGGAVAQGPRGGEAARGPGGQTAYRPPGGTSPANVNVNRNVNVSNNWNAYHRPGYGGVAAGAAAGLAVGATVGYLSAAARPVAVNNQTYYVDGSTYYQPCYQGTDVNYCVVPNPNQ